MIGPLRGSAGHTINSETVLQSGRTSRWWHLIWKQSSLFFSFEKKIFEMPLVCNPSEERGPPREITQSPTGCFVFFSSGCSVCVKRNARCITTQLSLRGSTSFTELQATGLHGPAEPVGATADRSYNSCICRQILHGLWGGNEFTWQRNATAESRSGTRIKGQSTCWWPPSTCSGSWAHARGASIRSDVDSFNKKKERKTFEISKDRGIWFDR